MGWGGAGQQSRQRVSRKWTRDAWERHEGVRLEGSCLARLKDFENKHNSAFIPGRIKPVAALHEPL